MNKKTTHYMLDANIAGYLIKGKPRIIRDHISAISMNCLFISSITEAELLLGVAVQYAKFRADCERQGNPLGTMDRLRAAHALTIEAVLVTNDRAFVGIYPSLKLADWTQPYPG